MATHHPPNAYLALRGGSLDYFSPYATTASLAASKLAPNKPRPPATPWMGEGQSRADRMSSSFQSATGLHTIAGPFEGASSAKLAFGRPVTASTHEIATLAARGSNGVVPEGTSELVGSLPGYPGDKNRVPLVACLHRGADKEPKYYPAIGATLAAEWLVTPKEGDPLHYGQRFTDFEVAKHTSATGIFAGDPALSAREATTAKVLGDKGDGTAWARDLTRPLKKPMTGFSTSMADLAAKGMHAPQSDGIFRQPSLTMREKERVLNDSTRRYFAARDYYDYPFLSTAAYYQGDALSMIGRADLKKTETDVAPNVRPATMFATMQYLDKPFADDVGDGVGKALPTVGEWATQGVSVTPDVMVTGDKLASGFSTNGPSGVFAKEPPRPQATSETTTLPERFARQRARSDYLHWGGDGPRFLSTARAEMPRPSLQVPLGGLPSDKQNSLKGPAPRVTQTEKSGYNTQNVSPDPILNPK